MIFGIALTIFACFAALGFWGRTIQIIGVIALGSACIIADIKGRQNSE